MLLCTPAVRAARLRWPKARIDVLGFAGTLGLLAGNPDVDTLLEFGRGGAARLRDARRLWRRYDLALVARIGDRAHLAGWVAAPLRSATLPAEGGLWKRLSARYGFVGEADLPVVLGNLRLLQPWLAPPAAVSVVPPAALALPAPLQSQLRRPRAVVHAPSMWRYKQWPIAHFRHVVDGLLAEGVQVVLSGSASANDQALVAPLREAGSEPALIDVSGRIQLQQLRLLLAQSDAYLGPDTSVTHLAAAVGVPIVTVFGPSQPQNFGPWPSDHPPTQPWHRRGQRQQARNIVLLQGPDLPQRTGCVPCNRMGCENRPDSASHCLEGLAPERVLAELLRLVRASDTTPHST